MLVVKYREVEGFQKEKPKTVDLTSSTTLVYLRRNIVTVPTLDAEGHDLGTTHWKYEEAGLTPQEYEEFLADTQSPSMEILMQTLSDMQLQIDSL